MKNNNEQETRDYQLKMRQLEVEESRRKYDELQIKTRASITYSKLITLIMITTLIILTTILTITLNTRIESEINCTINGVTYKNVNQKVLEQYNNPTLELNNSTIICSGKFKLPTYLLTNIYGGTK
jgi:hypothetical protein